MGQLSTVPKVPRNQMIFFKKVPREWGLVKDIIANNNVRGTKFAPAGEPLCQDGCVSGLETLIANVSIEGWLSFWQNSIFCKIGNLLYILITYTDICARELYQILITIVINVVFWTFIFDRRGQLEEEEEDWDKDPQCSNILYKGNKFITLVDASNKVIKGWYLYHY